MLITSAKLDEKIRSDPAGAYLFFGEEEYLKAHSLGVIRKTLVPDPGLAVFNHIKIDGGNVDALRDEINALPMFGMSGGTKLIELAEKYGINKSVQSAVLHVEKSNEKAYRLYKRLGYTVAAVENSRFRMAKQLQR